MEFFADDRRFLRWHHCEALENNSRSNLFPEQITSGCEKQGNPRDDDLIIVCHRETLYVIRPKLSFPSRSLRAVKNKENLVMTIL